MSRVMNGCVPRVFKQNDELYMVFKRYSDSFTKFPIQTMHTLQEEFLVRAIFSADLLN